MYLFIFLKGTTTNNKIIHYYYYYDVSSSSFINMPLITIISHQQHPLYEQHNLGESSFIFSKH
ncbi:hypothetical protein DERF_003770 [Dermatophagoides farinae]|uniref:Uncharacterized protein n=1 Tax=Dermatophagoides farinae TaxID=6954 RepID=A0A922IFC0_DERFA|nr:hypothetical protein DERF_003770 [Dermatophagoides farinae]